MKRYRGDDMDEDMDEDMEDMDEDMDELINTLKRIGIKEKNKKKKKSCPKNFILYINDDGEMFCEPDIYGIYGIDIFDWKLENHEKIDLFNKFKNSFDNMKLINFLEEVKYQPAQIFQFWSTHIDNIKSYNYYLKDFLYYQTKAILEGYLKDGDSL
jgi:hypothetical protein